MNVPLDHSHAFLTVKEMARILRVSETTVRNNARSGSIPGAVKHGVRWRFRSTAVLAWLDG